MRIQAINQYPLHSCVKRNAVKNQTNGQNLQNQSVSQPSFKGEKGGVIGILAGATIGALGAAAIIATGGLAGVVAAVGYGSTVVAGAASCTHIGGIAGSILEDKLDDKKE